MFCGLSKLGFNMEYTKELAETYIGKRVIVSIRNIDENNVETHSGLWGRIDSVYEDGMLLKIEGGSEEKFWMLPPEFSWLEPAQHKFYQMEGAEAVVENVDFEAYFVTANAVESLN